MIPDSDHLSRGVLRPVLGKALRGDKQNMYTLKGELTSGDHGHMDRFLPS